MTAIDWRKSQWIPRSANELLCPLCSIVDQADCPHIEEDYW